LLFYYRIVSPISHTVKQKFHLFMRFREDTGRSHSCQGYFFQRRYRQVLFMPGLLFWKKLYTNQNRINWITKFPFKTVCFLGFRGLTYLSYISFRFMWTCIINIGEGKNQLDAASTDVYSQLVNFHTARTAHVPAPHDHSQHNQANTMHRFIQSVLLTMGIMMPETCWEWTNWE